MVKKITPKPNTFYHKQDLISDTGVVPTFSDVYQGLSSTFTLESNPATTYLLAESNIVSPSDYVYGEGTVNEMYISAYANSIFQHNPQTSPYLDVYNLRDNLSITEGNQTITSGAVGLVSQFTSYYDTGMPFIAENFDGTEKHLFNFTRTKAGGKMMFYHNYKIKLSELFPLLREHYYVEAASDAIDVMEEDDGFVDSLIEWGKTSADIYWTETKNIVGVPEWGGSWVPLVDGGWFNWSNPIDAVNWDFDVPLVKTRGGLYYADIGPALDARGATDSNMTDAAKGMIHNIGWWESNGAFKSVGQQTDVGLAEFFADDYLLTADASNTIFSDVFMDGDVRDIKDQTLEGPGDGDRFLAYAYANIINTDSYSEEQSCRMRLFWENYSGATTGAEAKEIANPFGYVSTPVSQDLVSSIHGIPMPYIYDQSTPDTNFSGKSSSGSAAFCPEIEIVFKIRQMDRAPLYTGSSNLNGGNGFPSLERAFNIIGGTTAPTGDEVQISNYNQSYLPTAGFRAFMFATGANVSGVDMVDVIGNADNVGRDVYGHMWYSGNAATNDASFHTTLPKGKWIRSRIKFQTNKYGKGAPLLMYFPEEFESTGEMKSLVLKTQNDWTDLAAWYNHLTFWVNNQRSINDAPGSWNTNHINNGYAQDPVPNDDKTVDIILDSISFFNWNIVTKNNTICRENVSPGLINIPSSYATPQSLYVTGNVGNPSTEVPPKISIQSTSGNAENIYAQPSVPIATYLSWGFDGSQTSPAYRGWMNSGTNLMFNDFSTINPADISKIPDALIRAKIFGQNTYPFSHYRGWWNNSNNGAVYVSSTALPDGGIELGGAVNMVDGFSQKGYVHLSGNASTPGFGTWQRTGNPFVSAKILNIEENGTVITVDNTNIFNLPSDTRYVVEGSGPVAGSNMGTLSGSGVRSVGYNAASGSITAKKLSDGRIELSRSILKDDDGTSYKYNLDNNTFGRGCFVISPYKYWLVMAILNASGSDANTWGGWWDRNGKYFEPIYNASVGRGDSRTYNRMIPTSGGSIAGTTYNESIFTDGVYANRQSLSLWDPDSSVINLTTNYGYGALSANDDAVVTSEGGIGFMGRDKITSGSNYINISNYVPVSKPKEGAKFNFLIKPTYDESSLAGYHINVNTDDATTNPLQVLYGIIDPLPVVNNLSVISGFDPNTVDPNEFTSTASNVTFNWDEESQDTWYRMLFVDSINIQNKYHRTNFWAPLNDLPPDFTTPITPSTFGYYTSSTDTSKTYFNTSGNTVPDIEGLQGYAAKFDGTGDYLVTSGVIPLAVSTNKYSWMGHCTPSATNGGIFDVYSNSPSDFKIELSSSRIKVYHSGSNKTLTSTNVYDCDGVQPLQIAVTYDKNVQANNWKLYVNNTLEDTQDYTTGNISISGNVFIGASGNSTTSGSNYFNGFIEEIISYSGNCIHFPSNARQYKYNTSPLDDVVTGSTSNISINHTSRLFVMDYHNVRGKGTNEVSRTNTASWKVTSI